ncbi:MAG: CBS domain-containing protein [Candidatus Omnitrophota bacterium]
MNKYRILLIDDEEPLLSSLARALRDDQYEISMCQSAEEAMAVIEKQDIDLVICDYKLYRMNGIDFLEKITKENPDIIPILLTGQADIQIAVEAVNRLSLEGFITKPWDNEKLKATVRNSLENRGRNKLTRIKAKDIMSKFAITIQEDASLAKAAHLMMRFKISGLPVLSPEGKLTGIITATDLFRVMGETAGSLNLSESASKINSVMTEEVHVINKNMSFLEIISLMCSKNIHTLPVLEGNDIVGVIGRRDVFYQYYKIFAECDK